MNARAKVAFLKYLNGRATEHEERAGLYRKRLPMARDKRGLKLKIKIEAGAAQYFRRMAGRVKRDPVE